MAMPGTLKMLYAAHTSTAEQKDKERDGKREREMVTWVSIVRPLIGSLT